MGHIEHHVLELQIEVQDLEQAYVLYTLYFEYMSISTITNHQSQANQNKICNVLFT